MKFIVGKNCGPTTLFRDLLECLLVDEGDETGKYIFGLCFPIGLADTGRPPRELGGGGGADELGRWEAGGHNSWPAGCFAESAKRWKEEMKITRTSPSFVASKNWMNW